MARDGHRGASPARDGYRRARSRSPDRHRGREPVLDQFGRDVSKMAEFSRAAPRGRPHDNAREDRGRESRGHERGRSGLTQGRGEGNAADDFLREVAAEMHGTERSRAGGAPGTLPGPPQHGATPAHEGAGHVGGMNGGDANGDAPAASGVELGAQYGAVYGAQYDPEDDDDDDDVPPPPPPPPPEDEEPAAMIDPAAAAEMEMMRAMGLVAEFGTSKGQEHEDAGAVKIKSTRTIRQYMNRKGGFNRGLPAEKTGQKLGKMHLQ